MRLLFWLHCGLIVVLGFLVYIPAISNGFIWDDDVMLTDNAVMKASDGLRRIWFSTELSDYFPLTSTSFWIEWRLWGMNPVGYNVTNILLHTISGLLLWRVLFRLKVPGAWLAAILFTVHPVCVASVDWIAERKNTLSLVFYLSALLLYLRYERDGSRRIYFFALGTFLLALLSKTSVVVLPIVFLLCAFWQRSKISRQDFVRTIPFFALSLILGLVTVWFQLHEIITGEAQPTDPFLPRVLGGSWALWFYLGKIFLPWNLSMVYPQWEIDVARFVSYLPGVLWLSALFIFWRFRRTWGKAPLCGFGYFTIALLPVLGILHMDALRFSQVADHLQYLAVPGVIALAVGTLHTLFQKRFVMSGTNPSLRWKMAGAIPVAILSLLTWQQSSLYVNEETLWRNTIAQNPNGWIGYHNLADTLAEQRRYDEAAKFYEEALRLEPDYAKAQNNFGNCLFILGRVDEAVDQFLDAIQNKPELAEAHNNLGAALYQRKEYSRSLDAFETAIKLKSDYGAAHFGAGNAALQLGQLTEALNHYFNAAKYNPDEPDVQYNIGIVLSVRGQTNAAISYLQNAVRMHPGHTLARQQLSLLLPGTE